MDLRESFAVYIDDRVEEERWISKEDILPSEQTPDKSKQLFLLQGSDELQTNVELLARAFKKSKFLPKHRFRSYVEIEKLADFERLVCSLYLQLGQVVYEQVS